jgi:tetratricopeptide (TPR) repeat protein
MSEFDWNGPTSARDEKDLQEAIRYFNSCVDENALKKNFVETKRKIAAGIHPSAREPFTKLGSVMASVLKESFGEEKLRSYNKSGPIPFFGDYLRAVKTRPERKKWPAFANEFAGLISGWEKDWNRTYTDYVRRLAVTPDTNFEEIRSELKKTFSGASFYKDFSEEFGAVSRYFLERGDPEKALSILSLDQELYPGSAFPYAALGAAYIWAGNFEAGRQNYKRAFEIDLTHPQVSPDQIVSLINQLRTAKKMREALEASLIFIDFFPKDARLYLETGNTYALSEQKEKAIEYYKKALELDPNLAAAKSNLEKLEKIK